MFVDTLTVKFRWW